eukprot:TRINITY_DN45630_c0_g1_i1.p1 TRINITY_DN45630_c0_g1~~TRINITY_DN45630_c0_g1_i1.p1  ORF type:complete len:204 (+),score=26.91 TRINITY_DN45630_c0_g1_i1:66-677(+)
MLRSLVGSEMCIRDRLYAAGLQLVANFPSSLNIGRETSWGGGYAVMTVAALTMLSALLVQTGTVVHPYLLADNRHYAFYIWKNLLGRGWWGRYLATPLYGLGLFAMARGTYSQAVATPRVEGSVAKKNGEGPLLPVPALKTFGLFCAVCLSLIPSPLLEPRYFITPFVMTVLAAPPGDRVPTTIQALLFGLVNLVTLLSLIHI